MNDKQFKFWKMRRSGMPSISIANVIGITRQGVSQALLIRDEKIDAPLKTDHLTKMAEERFTRIKESMR